MKKKLKGKRFENLEKCGGLLKHPPKPDDPGFDKVFIQGCVEKKGNTWNITVESDTPTVALNEKIRKSLSLNQSPTVKELAVLSENRGSAVTRNSLISGGTLLWVSDEKGQQRIVLFKRDKKAMVNPLCLTSPAGRCGELPSQTTVNELNEELIIVKGSKEDKDYHKLISFYRDKGRIGQVMKKRVVQLEEACKRMQGSWMEDALSQIKKGRAVKMLNLEQSKDITSGEQVVTVVKDKEGKVIKRDVIGNAFVYFDEDNNTVEIREIVKTKIPKECTVDFIIDGESPNREIFWLTPEELAKTKEKLVPAVKYYRDQIVIPKML